MSTLVFDRTIAAGGLTLSAIESRPESAVATVLALHGGGYSARYWDNPVDRAGSLLDLGPCLGYRVLAVDRPGYGASHGLVGDTVRASAQSRVILDLIGQLQAESGPIFVIGHSMGAIVALHVAAAAPAGALAGVEISGLPYVFEMGADPSDLSSIDYLPDGGPDGKRARFYGPDGTFHPGVMAADAEISLPIPAAEIIDALECPQSTPALAPRVTVPLQITRAEFEMSSGGGREGLLECTSLFTSSPRVVASWQVGSGHNISLHRVARAYHLRALAFFDEVLVATK